MLLVRNEIGKEVGNGHDPQVKNRNDQQQDRRPPGNTADMTVSN